MRTPCLSRAVASIWICALGMAFLSPAMAQDLPTPASRSDPGALTLQQAVELALDSHPDLRAAASGRELADARLSEAVAGRWPVLQFTETFNHSNNPVFVFGSLLEQARFGPQNFALDALNHPDPLNNFRSTLALKAPLFDHLDTSSRIARARIGRRQSDQQWELAGEQVRLEVIRAYFGVIVAESRRQVATEATVMSEADTKRVRDLYENGIVVESDLLAAQVHFGEFREENIRAEGELEIARAALNLAIGRPAGTPLTVQGRLDDQQFPLPGAGDLLRQALEHRPDYLQTRLATDAAREAIRGARGQYAPRLDFFAQAGASGRNLTTGSGDYAVGASLTINLLDRARSARVGQARAEAQMAQAEAERLSRQIQLEVIRTYQEYLSARERVAVAGQSARQAAEALRIVQDRYHEGLTTITEVLRAETALVQNRLHELEARYQQIVGYATTLKAVGGLTDLRPFVP